METAVLSSGSKGNSVLIKTKNTKILIDLGITKSYAIEKLSELNVDPNEIKAILITHTHTDHIQGLKTFLKTYKPILYVNKTIKQILDEYVVYDNYYIYENDSFTIDDVDENSFKTPLTEDQMRINVNKFDFDMQNRSDVFYKCMREIEGTINSNNMSV